MTPRSSEKEKYWVVQRLILGRESFNRKRISKMRDRKRDQDRKKDQQEEVYLEQQLPSLVNSSSLVWSKAVLFVQTGML